MLEKVAECRDTKILSCSSRLQMPGSMSQDRMPVGGKGGGGRRSEAGSQLGSPAPTIFQLTSIWQVGAVPAPSPQPAPVRNSLETQNHLRCLWRCLCIRTKGPKALIWHFTEKIHNINKRAPTSQTVIWSPPSSPHPHHCHTAPSALPGMFPPPGLCTSSSHSQEVLPSVSRPTLQALSALHPSEHS